MQEGWGRRFELLTLDIDTLSALLEPVAAGHPIISAEAQGGGLVNTNYKVTLSGWNDTVVVRLYTRDPSACRLERDIYQLAHASIPMPEVLYADPAGERCGRPYMVTRWVPGIKLDRLIAAGDTATIGGSATTVGETLAALGTYTFLRPGFFGPGLCLREPLGTTRESVLSFVATSLFDREAGQRLGNDLTRRVWKLLTEHAALLDEADGPATLVHGDYKAQNLLVRQNPDGSWGTAAVLDWEFAIAGSSLFDLSILLRYADTLPVAFEQGVIAGFRGAGGSLPPEWKRLIKLLDLLNLCEFLCSPDPRSAMISDVTALVRATINGWDSCYAR
ncbi:MAG: phosphotransferase family protein [Ktedonobacterales bacterium]